MTKSNVLANIALGLIILLISYTTILFIEQKNESTAQTNQVVIPTDLKLIQLT